MASRMNQLGRKMATLQECLSAVRWSGVAIEHMDRVPITYRELQTEIECVCELLHVNGIKKGDTVCVLLPNSVAGIVCALAITWMGAILVPLSAFLSYQEYFEYFADVEAKLVVIPAPLEESSEGAETDKEVGRSESRSQRRRSISALGEGGACAFLLRKHKSSASGASTSGCASAMKAARLLETAVWKFRDMKPGHRASSPGTSKCQGETIVVTFSFLSIILEEMDSPRPSQKDLDEIFEDVEGDDLSMIVYSKKYASDSTAEESDGRTTSKTSGAKPGSSKIAVLPNTNSANGVPLTHKQLATTVQSFCRNYRLQPYDRTMLLLPLFKLHSFHILISTLWSGGTLILPRGDGTRFSPTTFWADVGKYDITWFSAVPTIHCVLLIRARSELRQRTFEDANPANLERSAEQDSTEFETKRPSFPPLPNSRRPLGGQCCPVSNIPSQLRFVHCCGGFLSPLVLDQMRKTYLVPVHQSYSLPEAAHYVMALPAGDRALQANARHEMISQNPLNLSAQPLVPTTEAATVSAGETDLLLAYSMRHNSTTKNRQTVYTSTCVGYNPKYRVQIQDQFNRPLPSGKIGQVCIGGRNVVSGYYRRFLLNEQAFRGGLFHTNDFGWVDEHENLFVVTEFPLVLVQTLEASSIVAERGNGMDRKLTQSSSSTEQCVDPLVPKRCRLRSHSRVGIDKFGHDSLSLRVQDSRSEYRASKDKRRAARKRMPPLKPQSTGGANQEEEEEDEEEEEEEENSRQHLTTDELVSGEEQQGEVSEARQCKGQHKPSESEKDKSDKISNTAAADRCRPQDDPRAQHDCEELPGYSASKDLSSSFGPDLSKTSDIVSSNVPAHEKVVHGVSDGNKSCDDKIEGNASGGGTDLPSLSMNFSSTNLAEGPHRLGEAADEKYRGITAQQPSPTSSRGSATARMQERVQKAVVGCLKLLRGTEERSKRRDRHSKEKNSEEVQQQACESAVEHPTDKDKFPSRGTFNTKVESKSERELSHCDVRSTIIEPTDESSNDAQDCDDIKFFDNRRRVDISCFDESSGAGDECHRTGELGIIIDKKNITTNGSVEEADNDEQPKEQNLEVEDFQYQPPVDEGDESFAIESKIKGVPEEGSTRKQLYRQHSDTPVEGRANDERQVKKTKKLKKKSKSKIKQAEPSGLSEPTDQQVSRFESTDALLAKDVVDLEGAASDDASGLKDYALNDQRRKSFASTAYPPSDKLIQEGNDAVLKTPASPATTSTKKRLRRAYSGPLYFGYLGRVRLPPLYRVNSREGRREPIESETQ